MTSPISTQAQQQQQGSSSIDATQSAKQAAEQSATHDSPSTKEDTEDPTRFTIFKPSFVMWSVPRGRKDEQGLQIRLSAKYNFLTCSNTKDQNNFVSQNTCAIFNGERLQNSIGTFSIFFSYTTDFDIYIISDGSRELERNSRPVRNRMNSPGLHFNWNSESSTRKTGFRYEGARFSMVHHSNGQDLEFETLFTEESTDEEIRDSIANLASNNPSWTGGVSRGWNFIELSARFDVGRQVMNCKTTFLCTQISAGIKIPVLTDPSNEIW